MEGGIGGKEGRKEGKDHGLSRQETAGRCDTAGKKQEGEKHRVVSNGRGRDQGWTGRRQADGFSTREGVSELECLRGTAREGGKGCPLEIQDPSRIRDASGRALCCRAA